MYICMTIPMTPNFHIALKIIGYISWVLKVTCVYIYIYIYTYITSGTAIVSSKDYLLYKLGI